jgi:sulfur-oxidizing protein SoxX
MRFDRAVAAAVVAAIGVAMLGATAPDAAAQAQAATPPLVKFEIVDHAIPASLTGKPGNPQAGEKVVVGRRAGNCLACHAVTALEKEPFHGNTGPSLDGVASRLSEGEIRLRLVDATKVNPETMMPSFYRVEGLNRVRKQFEGKPVLTAEQIEDVIAFLMTLK